MKTSLKPSTYIQTWRLAAIMISSALAMSLPITAFAAPPIPHSAPTGVATSSPGSAWEGDTVTLDASASHSNPCCTTLTYQWQPQTGGPTVTLTPGITAVTATYVAPAVPLAALTQAVTYRVKVTDDLASGGDKNSFSNFVTTTVYASPSANAGPDVHANEGTLVTLSGSATRVQTGGTIVDYTWTAPAGITLSDIHAQNPTFTAPFVGPAGQALTFTLVVTEHLNGLSHDKDSAADSVTINVDNVNQPPTAYASADPNTIVDMAEVAENTDPVTLYGSGSDPDGDGLTFHWTQVHDTSGTPLQPGDTVVALDDNTSQTPTLTAPNLTTQDHVDLVFQLITNDGYLPSGPSYLTIRVLNTNDPPVAVPTATPAAALEGDMVTLDGSGSYDPNMDSLTYSWAQVGTPTVPLTGADSASASFIAPVVSAQQGQITLTFNLTVDDGEFSDTKPVGVTVSHRNVPPVADAGQTETVPEGSVACLNGSNSYDPEGDTLTFAWMQLDGPSVTLDDPSSSGPCFATPDVGPGGATLHFQLTVTDSHGASNSASVEANVSYVNHPPDPNAGDDQTVNEGDTVHLDGSGSSDPDNNLLLFSWSQIDGPPVTIVPDQPGSSKATFIAPGVPCAGGVVVMRLTVDDQYGGIVTDDVAINVANVNHNPTASGGGNQSNINEGDPVSLHGTGSDADTEEVPTLSFHWMQTSGPSVSLSGTGGDVMFAAPTIGGGDPDASVELGFQLTVTDICGGSATDNITVHVANIPHAPVAVATGPASANEGGDTVQLDGSMSYDPDFDPLTYTWTQCGGPAVALYFSPGDTGHVMPYFVTPWVSADTQLKFKLTVNDPWGGINSAYVTVTVNNWNQPPDVSGAHADVGVLWPPDHRLVPIHILGVVDAQNNATITINSVTQDERTNGLGDGDTPVDAFINGDAVQVRSERSGTGDGRVYRVNFTASDPEGSVNGTIRVMVPKSKKTDVAIDGGPIYDSTH
jgi:hypothetical protein